MLSAKKSRELNVFKIARGISIPSIDRSRPKILLLFANSQQLGVILSGGVYQKGASNIEGEFIRKEAFISEQASNGYLGTTPSNQGQSSHVRWFCVMTVLIRLISRFYERWCQFHLYSLTFITDLLNHHVFTII